MVIKFRLKQGLEFNKFLISNFQNETSKLMQHKANLYIFKILSLLNFTSF